MWQILTILFIVYEASKIRTMTTGSTIAISKTMVDIVYYIYLIFNIVTGRGLIQSIIILIMGLLSPLFKTSVRNNIIDSVITIILLLTILL